MERYLPLAVEYLPFVIWVLAAGALWRFGPAETDRNQARILLIGWIVLWTLPYWILGPASYLNQVDEGDYILPALMYLANVLEPGATFAHHVGGGSDPTVMVVSGGEFANAERWLVGLLPLPAAIVVHKILVVSVSVIGGYLVARKGCGAGRLEAAALAAAYSFSHNYLSITTFNHGVGYAAAALGIYVFVVRARAREQGGARSLGRYLGGTILFSLAIAASGSITHSFLAVATGILAAAIWLRPAPGRLVAVMVIFAIIMFANWHNVIFTLIKWAPLSARDLEPQVSSIGDMLTAGFVFFANKIRPLWVVAITLTVTAMVLLRHPRALTALAVTLGMILIGPAIIALPWDAIGLGPLKAMRLHVAILSLPAVAILFMTSLAQHVRDMSPAGTAHRTVAGPRSLFGGLAIATLLGGYPEMAIHYLSHGSARLNFGLENLRDRPWQPEEPSRVVTVPFMLKPMGAITYGLENFDSYTTMVLKSKARYWREMRQMARTDITVALSSTEQTLANTHDTDCYICDVPLDLSTWANLDMLRVGNVGEIISLVPLSTKSGDLTLISDADRPWLDRAKASFLQRRLFDLKLAFGAKRAYVYRLGGALPRAFFARGAMTAPAPRSSSAFHALVAREAVRRTAVLASDDTDASLLGLPAAGAAGGPAVLQTHIRADGFDIAVDAPNGGLLIVNSPYLPFWAARLGGRALPIAPVNGIHMAVPIPAGTGTVELRYAVPGLFSR